MIRAMTRSAPKPNPLEPELLLKAYCLGVFPMAETRHGDIGWYSPDPRAIVPLDRFRVPRSLDRRLRRETWPVTTDRAFEDVIRACADTPRRHEDDTWINDQIIDAFTELHARGHAHSLEAWSADGGRLIGGLYGLAIGGAFFGESMFSRATDASKVCLVELVDRLLLGGFALLDVQVQSPHLAQFGSIEIPRERYLSELASALSVDAAWPRDAERRLGAFDAPGGSP